MLPALIGAAIPAVMSLFGGAEGDSTSSDALRGIQQEAVTNPTASLSAATNISKTGVEPLMSKSDFNLITAPRGLLMTDMVASPTYSAQTGVATNRLFTNQANNTSQMNFTLHDNQKPIILAGAKLIQQWRIVSAAELSPNLAALISGTVNSSTNAFTWIWGDTNWTWGPFESLQYQVNYVDVFNTSNNTLASQRLMYEYFCPDTLLGGGSTYRNKGALRNIVGNIKPVHLNRPDGATNTWAGVTFETVEDLDLAQLRTMDMKHPATTLSLNFRLSNNIIEVFMGHMKAGPLLASYTSPTGAVTNVQADVARVILTLQSMAVRAKVVDMDPENVFAIERPLLEAGVPYGLTFYDPQIINFPISGYATNRPPNLSVFSYTIQEIQIKNTGPIENYYVAFPYITYDICTKDAIVSPAIAAGGPVNTTSHRLYVPGLMTYESLLVNNQEIDSAATCMGVYHATASTPSSSFNGWRNFVELRHEDNMATLQSMGKTGGLAAQELFEYTRSIQKGYPTASWRSTSASLGTVNPAANNLLANWEWIVNAPPCIFSTRQMTDPTINTPQNSGSLSVRLRVLDNWMEATTTIQPRMPWPSNPNDNFYIKVTGLSVDIATFIPKKMSYGSLAATRVDTISSYVSS
jgi:hypothetical protein